MTSPTHISSLPEDVLINIFERLHGNKKQSNLIKATLVCKKWNRIISQTHSLMNKLQLKLKLDSIKLYEKKIEYDAAVEDLKPSRNYHYVVWDNEWVWITVVEILNEISKLSYLNTLQVFQWFSSNAELIESFQKLSRCKFLRCLIFESCSITTELHDQEIEEINRIEFNSLKKLQLNRTESGFLKNIKCKELDSFHYESLDRNFSNSDRHIVTFLNQLDRCDEISVEFRDWNFDNNFKPKFLWNKLRLFSKINESKHSNAAISSVVSFLEASTTNATADIELSDFDSDSDDSSLNIFWLEILNSYKVITSLTFNSSKLPFILTQLRNLPELRTLNIPASLLEDVDNFSNFINKISNVTQLKISSRMRAFIDLPADSRLFYQPFFNQVTELTLDSCIVDSKSWPNRYNSEESHLISIITCENLNLIRIDNSNNFSLEQFNDLFLRFCNRNRNLRRVEVVGNIPHWSSVSNVFNSENEDLIKWYNQLQEFATTIETCNVMVVQKENQTTSPVNWRIAKIDEIELFGRSLTDDESRFFI